MKTTGQLKPLTLLTACQRLASYASTIQTNKHAGASPREEEVKLLVMRALDILQLQVPESIVPGLPVKGGITGLLARMVRSGGESTKSEMPDHANTAGKSANENRSPAMQVSGEFVSVPNLIGFLSGQSKTGTLVITTPDDQFTVEFEAGDIVHAQCRNTPNGQRMGDILVSSGAVSRADLERARREASGGRLGEVLLERDLVSRETLVAALQTQIQLFFNRLFDAVFSQATFTHGPPVHADEHVRLNATSLLLEGARISDETNWVRRMEIFLDQQKG